VSIARRIMESTPHIMLAAEGAEAFASATGFAPAELLSPSAAAAWRRWKAAPHTVDQSADRGSMSLRPVDRGRGGQLFQHDEEARRGGHDTIGVLAIDGRGIMAGACSTSGTPYKLPGRVGDSPIIGHGLYVDPPAGGATATGTGELIMGVCGSFLAVEQMRRGASPREAAITVLHRIAESLTLRPDHQVAVLTLRPDGAWAGAALHPGFKASISTTEGHRIADPDDVLLASSSRS
jgi:isoaspartyl peptidase/L-asparaginase-like protein (Ntn-hydrolase superfamily)